MRRAVIAPLFASLLAWSASAAQGQKLEGGFDLAEYHFEGDNSLFIDGGLSYGSDAHRLVLKTGIGGSVGRRVDEIEAQLLYARAIGGNFSILAGVRHEFRPHPHWTYGVIGIEGEPAAGLGVESYVFVSERGDFLAELKAIYDHPISKRLTLQPRATLNLSAQSVPRQGLGTGITDTELGLRIRFEVAPLFAPYVGISHERLLGKTADRARVAGEVVRATHLVVGFSSSF